MCGIVGIVDYRKQESRRVLVKKMMETLSHRGPDGDGLYENAEATFGHVRLSIIDVQGSHQPLSNEDGTIWVTFNGEIYNFQELRQKLLAKGHVLKTKGDTETLVHLYEEYGPEMITQLQGMFSFAIWDQKNKQLLIARDRMGIKPLYYARCQGEFLFASEPKAILQHPQMHASPKPESIWYYLTYRSVPSPLTLFDGIHKLNPGHYLLLNPEGLEIKQYWDIPLQSVSEKKTNLTEDGVIDQADQLLRQSVQRRMISDVPLGAFLSGGVDSSLIVAIMSKLTNTPVKTYSVGFKDFPSSELPYAKVVADYYQADHHELVLEEEVFVEYLEKLTWMRDSPLSERSDVPLYLLAKEARKKVKVLLSGEGSDELFAGYPKYAFDRFAPYFSLVPGSVTGAIGRMLPAKLRRLEIALRSYGQKNEADRWAQWFSPFTTDEKVELLKTVRMGDNPTAGIIEGTTGFDNLDRMLYADCKIWLPENLLERGDRMTMATSVEGRVPFLDHELVEFAFHLPRNFKCRGFNRKWLVKMVAERYLPHDIIYRKKVGFEVPLAQWFRGKLKDMCYDRICHRSGLAGELFSRRELMKILDDHCADKKDNFLKIWTLLGLSIWHDLFCRQ